MTKYLFRDRLAALLMNKITRVLKLIMIFRFCFLFSSCLFSLIAVANPSLEINKIVIQGNKIVEEEAIRSKITSKVNQQYSNKKTREDVQRIFSTGWFHDVEVHREAKANKKVTLIYKVKEKPVVEKIIYKGNNSLSKKDLDEIFNFSAYDFFSYKKIKLAIKGIKDEYEQKGYYLAQISHSVKKTSQEGKIHLEIHIKENKKVKVKRIRFIGNQSILSKELKSFMGTRESGLLSFITSAGSYSQEVLEKDLNNIRFIYMDRGYWKIFVGVPEIIISPDKTDITINISIQEGDQYKAGTISFSGDLIFDTSYLEENMETEESEVFSYGKLQRDIKRIETKYGDKGYAFVNIIPKFFNLPTDDGKTIHVLFEIQKGKKVNIGMIHITGNDYTRDKVIRREMRIFEGELYNETNKTRSVENIRRLGFFDDVKIMSKTIKSRDDLVDMEVNIKERENTGTLELGAGYDGYLGFSFNGKIHKFNLFGMGYNVGLDAVLKIPSKWFVDVEDEGLYDGPSRQYIKLNFSDPYFLDSNWYFGGDFYLEHWSGGTSEDGFAACKGLDKKQTEYDNKLSAGQFKKEEDRLKSEKNLKESKELCWNSFPDTNFRGFSEQKISGGITFGRSLFDTLRLLFYYRLESVELTNTIDDVLYPVESANGLRNPIQAIVEYDQRNDRLFPTAGVYSESSLSYDGLFGKFNYLTLSANLRFYQTLFWDIVFRMNVQYSQHFNLYEGEGTVPFDRLFLLGGIHSLRGFKYYSVGPRKKSEKIYQKALQYGRPHAESVSQRVFGGNKEFYTNLELQFPVFPEAQLLGVVFMDIGTAYNKIEASDLRMNWGFGLRMFTPVGPIRLEMGFPFDPRPEFGEKSSELQITMGLPF